ncbi:MAG: hypothetical protein IIA23_07665 [Chloroflexi bacterium]|nr:hypothetical protein [Chloroflexota bacterium]
MRFRWWQAALLAGMLAAGLLIGAPGAGGQSPDPPPPTPTPRPGPPPGIEAPLGRPGEPPPSRPEAAPAPSLLSSVIAPALTASFDGVGQEADSDGFIHSPPDTHAAAGPDRIVEITNGHVAIFSKAGAVIAGGAPSVTGTPVDLDAFCENEGCFDPKVIYDQGADRFVAVVLEGTTANTSFLHVMVSKTSSPGNLTTDWDKFRHSAKTQFSSGPPGFFDYPGLGVSADAVVVTGNIFSTAFFLGTRIRVFDKAELYDGDATATFVDIDNTASSGHTIQPAHHFGSPPAGTFYLLQRVNATNLRVWALTGVPASPTATPTLLSTSDQGACVSTAPQKDTDKRLDTVCPRMMNAVWRDGSLWGTLTGSDATDTRAIVQWFEVETNGFPSASPTLRQHGTIDGGTTEEEGEFTFMPSISVDGCGNAALTYTQSSDVRFPEMRYTGRLAGDALDTMQTPVIAKASAFFFDDFTSSGGRERWGDYSATFIDPSDQSFWIAHEYAKVPASDGGNNGRWGTWLANFSFDCALVDITLATDGTLTFGTLELSATADSSGDVQTVEVVTGPADIDVRTTLWTDVDVDTWSLGATSGTDQVVWEFSTDGMNWTPFTAANLLFPAAQGLTNGQELNLSFRLTMPNEITSSKEHSVTVTIVATSP